MDKKITLPNKTQFPYRSYTVPCCKECNQFLGTTYETPISKLFAEGPRAVIDAVNGDQAKLLFEWMCLIYFKTHLKDLRLRANRDRRMDGGSIGESYDWTQFHHVHAVARSRYCGVFLEPHAVGSLCAIQVMEGFQENPFDYNDNLSTETIMIRIGATCFIVVVNDSGAVNDMIVDRLPENLGSVNLVQIAEILTEYQCASAHLLNRPRFSTEFSTERKGLRIKADFPSEREIAEYSADLRGEMMLNNLKPLMNFIRIPGKSKEEMEKEILTGSVSFLPRVPSEDPTTQA